MSMFKQMKVDNVIQYISRNMHAVFALLCFVVVVHWLIFPYPPGLLRRHCGNLTIAPVPAKQPWWIWINTSCEIIMNDNITTTKQSTTKPCAYFLGYTVYHMKCISTVPEEMEAINNNSSEWICRSCLMHIFLFNNTNDDSEFIQLCSNRQKHGCQISDLLYNPYDSNSEEYMGFQDSDPDTNFYFEKKLCNGLLCNYNSKDSFHD